MVAAWIGAAYWFTASTSFANPAITIARSLSDTFSGIRPGDVPPFIAAQFMGALLALAAARYLFRVGVAVDRTARQKIRSQKREVAEGTEEWDLLHRRYYSEELKKLGIDLTR